MITLPKTAAREEEEEKRCKEEEDIIVVAQDNTGGPRVYKLEKKMAKRKQGAEEDRCEEEFRELAPCRQATRIASQVAANANGSERAIKTHFVPVLQATDCTRQERRKTNGRTDGRTHREDELN
jgi:superfamily I DNA and RNA helicase